MYSCPGVHLFCFLFLSVEDYRLISTSKFFFSLCPRRLFSPVGFPLLIPQEELEQEDPISVYCAEITCARILLTWCSDPSTTTCWSIPLKEKYHPRRKKPVSNFFFKRSLIYSLYIYLSIFCRGLSHQFGLQEPWGYISLTPAGIQLPSSLIIICSNFQELPNFWCGEVEGWGGGWFLL